MSEILRVNLDFSSDFSDGANGSAFGNTEIDTNTNANANVNANANADGNADNKTTFDTYEGSLVCELSSYKYGGDYSCDSGNNGRRLWRRSVGVVVAATSLIGCVGRDDVASSTSRYENVSTTVGPMDSVPAESHNQQNVSTTELATNQTEVSTESSEALSHKFEHGEEIPEQLHLTLSRTGQEINQQLYAFTDSKSDLIESPILDKGAVVLTGDSYPISVFGFDEKVFEDSDGTKQILPMAIGVHRTTQPNPAGKNITEIMIRSEQQTGDILSIGSDKYEAVKMLLVAGENNEEMSSVLGSYYPEKTVFIFTCTEDTLGAREAVEATNSGAHNVQDPYVTKPNKNPDAYIMVMFTQVS